MTPGADGAGPPAVEGSGAPALRSTRAMAGRRPPGGNAGAAMDGLAEEGEEIIEEYKDAPAGDAGLLAAAQAIEHYEIARYGTLAAWARQLGNAEGERLLRETLAEEEQADSLLTELAEA